MEEALGVSWLEHIHKGTHTLSLRRTRYTCIHAHAQMQRFKIISLAAVGTWLCWEGDSCCITSAFCSLQRLPESHVSAAAEHSRAEHTETDTKADVHVHPHLHTLFFKEGHTHRQKGMKIFNKKNPSDLKGWLAESQATDIQECLLNTHMHAHIRQMSGCMSTWRIKIHEQKYI